MSIRKSLDALIEKYGGTCPEGNQIDEAIDALCACEIGGGASSWNDLEDRPFYTEYDDAVLASDVSCEFYEEDGNYAILPCDRFKIHEGKTYTVTYDGTVYECVAKRDVYSENGEILSISNYIGSTALFLEESTNDEEPFVIWSDLDVETEDVIGCAAVVSTDGTHTFSIVGAYEIVHCIHNKFVNFPKQVSCLTVDLGETPLSEIYEQQEAFMSSKHQDGSACILLFIRRRNSNGGFTIDTFFLLEYEYVMNLAQGIYLDPNWRGGRNCIVKFITGKNSDGTRVYTDYEITYPTDLYINSSTSGSSKQFRITVDDTGNISATEIV